MLGMSGSVTEGDALEYGESDQRGVGLISSTGRYTSSPGQGLGQGLGPGQGLGQGQGRASTVSFNVGSRGALPTSGSGHGSGHGTGTRPSSAPGQGLATGPGAEQPTVMEAELLENILLQESVIDQLGVDTLEAFVTQVTDPPWAYLKIYAPLVSLPYLSSTLCICFTHFTLNPLSLNPSVSPSTPFLHFIPPRPPPVSPLSTFSTLSFPSFSTLLLPSLFSLPDNPIVGVSEERLRGRA